MRTIFDYRKSSGTGGILPDLDVPERGATDLLPSDLIRHREPRIPNLSEPEVVRHYTALSKLNYGIDDGLYPLGSCTMKYNPKVNEDVANLPGFVSVHPAADPNLAQGSLAVMYKMSRLLCGITGMADVTLQPAAGA